jgi:hypothetical protein
MAQRPPVDRHVWQQNIERIRQSIPPPQPIAPKAAHKSDSVKPVLQHEPPSLSTSASLLNRSVSRPIKCLTPFVLGVPRMRCRSIKLTAKVTQITRHPFAAVGAAWLLSICVGSIAAISIFKINPNLPTATSSGELQRHVSEQVLTEGLPRVTDSALPQGDMIESGSDLPVIATYGATKETLPLFSLGIVALGCAAGCLLLSRHFHTSLSRQPPQFPSQSRVPRIGANPSRQSSRRRTKKLLAQEKNSVVATQRHAKPASPSVAVVPAYEDHPLDWNESSIADDLDIRHQRPLSRWL